MPNKEREVTGDALVTEVDAIEALAKVLYERMEHLDPTVDVVDWAVIADDEREFFILCIKSILYETELLKAALDRLRLV